MSFRPADDDSYYDKKSTYHAEQQLSSKTGVVKEINGTRIDVEFPDGRVLRRVPSANGIKYEIGMHVRIERCMSDWQAIGIG